MNCVIEHATRPKLGGSSIGPKYVLTDETPDLNMYRYNTICIFQYAQVMAFLLGRILVLSEPGVRWDILSTYS